MLKDTVSLMTSENYKDRFVAEYIQTRERYESLHNMIVRYEAGTLDFTPTCSIELLKRQANFMSEYLYVMEIRAQYEKIDLREETLKCYGVITRREAEG